MKRPSQLERTAALAAIRSNVHRHTGIRPTSASARKTADAVAFPIDATANVEDELDYAIANAVDYWPAATEFDVLGCDLVNAADRSQLPPEAVVMRSPDTLGSFSVDDAGEDV